jgi:kinesin family member 18/19
MTCNEESINTLKYASRARAIKKKITQNIRPIDNNNNNNNNNNNDIVPLLQAEIALLK